MIKWFHNHFIAPDARQEQYEIMPFPPGHYNKDGTFTCYCDIADVQEYSKDDLDTVCRSIHTDIPLKTLSRRLEVFNRKIIMRRNSMIFYPEKHRIDNAVRRCLSN